MVDFVGVTGCGSQLDGVDINKFEDQRRLYRLLKCETGVLAAHNLSHACFVGLFQVQVCSEFADIWMFTRSLFYRTDLR